MKPMAWQGALEEQRMELVELQQAELAKLGQLPQGLRVWAIRATQLYTL